MKDYDSEIAAVESEQQALLVQMESAAAAFRGATEPFLSSFYENRAKDEATRNPTLTATLGKEGISELKQEVGALQQNVKAIVDEVLGDDALWWHKSGLEKSSHDYVSYAHHGRGPDTVENALRLAAGRLAPVLEKFGYLEKTGDRNTWRDRSHYSSRSHRYPYSLTWSAQMIERVNQYNELLRQTRTISEKLASLKRKKQEQEAKDLWDSV